MLSEASLLRCAGCHGQPWGAHHRHLLVEIFLGFRESEQDNAWLEFVCMQFCKWAYPKSKLWDLKCCSCGNSFVSWRWMHMAISSRCPWCDRSGTCKGKWNIVITNFVHCSNRPVRTVGTVAVLSWFFSPAQLTSWYGIFGIFVVIPPDRIVWPRVATSSQPRRSSFLDQDLAPFVGC